MERDFLGVVEKDQLHTEDEGRKDSAYFGGGGGGSPAMDWSFATRADAAPALMSFRSAAREEMGELPFTQFSSFDSVRKQHASRVLTPQRSFGAESHGSQQYAAMRSAYGGHSPQHQQHVLNGARVIPVSSPFNPNNPMFRVQSSPNLPNAGAGGGAFKQPPIAMNNAVNCSRVGVYGTRDMPKQNTAQLTIFYAGSVNVFNNVSAEKAQELMLLASRESLPSASSTVALDPNGPFLAPAKFAAPKVSPAKQMLLPKPHHVSPPVSDISKPISIVSQAACLPRSVSSSNIDPLTPNSSAPLAVAPTSQPPLTRPATLTTTKEAAAIMQRAVPQARKASLARFLEKRKERVTTVAPYTLTMSPVESSDTVGSANDYSKSSCTDIAFSSYHDESLHLGQPRNISFCVESPSTKLQM